MLRIDSQQFLWRAFATETEPMWHTWQLVEFLDKWWKYLSLFTSHWEGSRVSVFWLTCPKARNYRVAQKYNFHSFSLISRRLREDLRNGWHLIWFWPQDRIKAACPLRLVTQPSLRDCFKCFSACILLCRGRSLTGGVMYSCADSLSQTTPSDHRLRPSYFLGTVSNNLLDTPSGDQATRGQFVLLQ